MSRAFVATWRLARALLHLLYGRVTMRLHFGSLDAAGRHARIQRWSAILLRRLGVKLTVQGTPRPGATLLVAGAGALFIERENKRAALRVVHQVAAALRAGDMVAVFPEGTTGPGRALLPFHANLLQAAIATTTPVQPVLLRFHQPGQAFSVAAEFVGDTTLLQQRVAHRLRARVAG